MKKKNITIFVFILIFFSSILINLQLDIKGKNRYDIKHACCGFIGTGSCIRDGKSLLFKHRWLNEIDQKPIYFKGPNYVFWGVGDGINSFCRMGLNEVGLAIANFDPPEDSIDDGLWNYISDHTSVSEDDDMMTVLGTFSNVSDAAYWLANHAFYPCQWIIISAESGVGAVVGMDKNYHVNISWINNTWTAIGNNWFCENYQSSWYINRVNYLIDRSVEKNIMYDQSQSNKIGIRDLVRIIGKDQNASDENRPWWSEPKPNNYSGRYSSNGIAGVWSCHASMAVVSGDSEYGGATATAWITFADTTPLGVYLPLGCSYVIDSDDIYYRWLNGMQQYTDVKKNYVEISSHVYDRSKMHSIQNFSVEIENYTFDAYEEFLEGLTISLSYTEIANRLKQFCDIFTERGIKFYIKNKSISYNKYDVNFDGKINFIDMIIVLLFSSKYFDYKWYYDVNNDDVVDFVDVWLCWTHRTV